MGAFLKNISMLCLMRTAADMLLPEGNLRRICDMLLGLMVMLCMLEGMKRLMTELRL